MPAHDSEWYVHETGEQSGPFSIDEIRAFMTEGTVTTAALVGRNGMDEWVGVTTIIPPPLSAPTRYTWWQLRAIARGGLEQPYLWGEHVVCPGCLAVLQQQQQIAQPVAAQDSRLCQVDGVRVTARFIEGQGGALRVDHVLSVNPEKAFFTGCVVNVRDLTKRTYKYRFRSADNANRFIGALRRANPAVSVENDDVGWFVIWW